MITIAELENMVNDESEKKYPDIDNHWQQIALNGFKSGCSFVTGILMHEIERLKLGHKNLNDVNDNAAEDINTLHKELSEANATIQSLKDENKRMKEVIKCCDSDYWFMINLIEHYSTNKDDALKDCLERMKFRKPMFKTALNQGEGEK